MKAKRAGFDLLPNAENLLFEAGLGSTKKLVKPATESAALWDALFGVWSRKRQRLTFQNIVSVQA